MGIASVILGVLGLIGICVGLPIMQPIMIFGGGACALAAFIIGLVGRRSGAAATAGMVLGLLGSLGLLALFFLFTARSPVSSGPVEVSAPANPALARRRDQTSAATLRAVSPRLPPPTMRP